MEDTTKLEQEVAQVVNDNSIPEDPKDQEEFDVDKAVEMYDVTKQTRKDALDQSQKILKKTVSGARTSGGWNIDKKEQLKVMNSLYVVCMIQDMLITALMGDLMRAVRGIASTEGELFNLTAKMFTITETLKDKGLVSAEEFEKVHQEKTVPQLMARLQKEQEEK